ncbi:hypothetical protein [Nocardia sp. NPDC004722]
MNTVGRDMNVTKVFVMLREIGYWLFPVLALVPIGVAFFLGLPGNFGQLMLYLLPGLLALIVGSAVPVFEGGRRWLAISVSVALCVMSGLLLSHAWKHADLDVTDQIHQTDYPSLVDGDRRTVTIDLPRQRSALALSFRFSEINGDQICVPHTTIQVSTASDGDGGNRLAPDDTATVRLDHGRKRVVLYLRFNTDHGCVVDLHISKAVLRDH